MANAATVGGKPLTAYGSSNSVGQPFATVGGLQVKGHAYKIINGKYGGRIDVDMNKLQNKLLLDISIAGQRFLPQAVDLLTKDIIQTEAILNYQETYCMI